MATADAAGAEAFVRHYFVLVNHAQATGDLEPLRAVSGAGCSGCQGGLKALEEAARKGESLDGGDYAVARFLSFDTIDGGRFVISLLVANTAQRVHDKNGKEIRRYEAAETKVTLRVRAVDSANASWQVQQWTFK